VSSVIEGFEEWAHLRHPHHDPQTAQESTAMSRIAAAQGAIQHAQEQLAGLTGNALAEAIAEAGVGLAFQAEDIRLVLAMIRAIEHGPTPMGVQQPVQTPVQQLQQT
jgi:hypothetical protein